MRQRVDVRILSRRSLADKQHGHDSFACVHPVENPKSLPDCSHAPHAFQGRDERLALLIWCSNQPVNDLGDLTECFLVFERLEGTVARGRDLYPVSTSHDLLVP